MIKIKEVLSKEDLKTFVRIPFEIFRDCPYWVPPLDFDEINVLSSETNPAFEFCDAKYWIALKDDKPVGRVAAIINHTYNTKTGKKLVRFGWFDTIDDYAVSSALIGAVEDFAVSLGYSAVHGPLGFTDMDKQGMMIDGFDKTASIISLYNHEYYTHHLERLGFVKDVDWLEFMVKIPEEVPYKISRLASKVEDKYNLRVGTFKSRTEVKRFAPKIFELWNEEFSKLYGYVPVEGKLQAYYIKQYFNIINPNYVRVLLDSSDKVVGFGLSMPSMSEAFIKANGKLFPFGFLSILKSIRYSKTVDLYTVAVSTEYQRKGAITIIMKSMLQSFIDNKVEYALASAQLEENIAVHSMWGYFETNIHKRRRCYVKQL